MSSSNRRAGLAFTLIELLVVIAIIAILTAVLIPSISKARQLARTAHELCMLRQVNIGYITYAQENDNRLLPGMISSARVSGLVDELGNVISNGHQEERWPWRLFNASHQNMNLIHAMFIGERRQTLFVKYQQQRADNPFIWHYATSQSPSFGLNFFNLGGDLRGVTIAQENGENAPTCITKTTEARNPGQLITFASSRSNPIDGTVSGPNDVFYTSAYGKNYCEGIDRIISPSRVTRNPLSGAWNAPSLWSPEDYQEQSDTQERWGYIHPRCAGKAAVAFLDGHAETMTINQLRDNSLWTNQP